MDTNTSLDLPALYRAADTASVKAQGAYLRLMMADLSLLVTGSLLTAFAPENSDVNKVMLAIGAFLLAAGAIITLVLSQKTYKKRWYGGRAAAESVKTLAWRYMMCSEPFERGLPSAEADRLFVQSLHDVLRESEYLAVSFKESIRVEPQITEHMRAVRKSSLAERTQLYLEDRVRDQRTWYSKKSSANARNEVRLFVAVAVAQLLAILAAIVMVVNPDSWINPTGVFATVAAACLAWLQLKQHEDLAQSYAVAAHELGLIAEQARYAKSERDFAVFVADSESAISREHTLWLARRDHLSTLPRQL